MKHKKLITLALTLPLVAVVAGCSKTKVDPDAVLPENQRHFYDEEEKVTLRQVVHDGEKQGNPAPTKGNTRVLVIPVEFSDFPAEEIGMYYGGEGGTVHYDGSTPGKEPGTGRGADNALIDINNTYFGNPEDTAWHSLSSYYRESSYGKLNFNGIVLPWGPAFTNFNTKAMVSAKEFKDNGGSAKQLALDYLDWYANYNKWKEIKDEHGNQMFKSGSEFLKYFDSDSDGYVDLVELVYSAPYHAQYKDAGKWKEIDNDLFWAYCGSTSLNPNPNKPNMSKYAFQSYYTMVEGGYTDPVTGKHKNWIPADISAGLAKVDAHTIIHETGHGLGLPDYYSTDAQSGQTSGAVDMMAFNIGDHDSHSKSLLGWVDPVVVKGPTEVKVRSFTDTGDCIYIPYRGYYDDGSDIDKKYKNTFNTEYIAIEYMTPTGVNLHDSLENYNGTYPLVPNQAGVKIYHVDSRLGVMDYSAYPSIKLVSYTSSIVSVSSSNVMVTHAHTNTPSTTQKNAKGNYCWQLEYLYKDFVKRPAYITNDSLYQAGDVIFSGDYYADYEFNSGNKFGYKVTIKSIDSEGATILIEAAK